MHFPKANPKHNKTTESCLKNCGGRIPNSEPLVGIQVDDPREVAHGPKTLEDPRAFQPETLETNSTIGISILILVMNTNIGIQQTDGIEYHYYHSNTKLAMDTNIND